MADPHQCVILAIDPGQSSGWAIAVSGRPTVWGRASTHAERSAACELADVEADRHDMALVVVAEKWTAGGWASHTTLLGLGAAWGAWRSAIEEAGIKRSRIVRVYTQTWRARVLRPRWGATTEQLKHLSASMASAWTGEIIADHDVADALGILRWATLAPQVGEAIPRRKRVKP